ncbi:class I SAM-dependent methyltransferase [Halobacteriales archaeon QS_8_69_26]|nr:MAG: class I SAM-dependent methyltransferase [Halobacteriales archaeon QS_8_69_26]
MSDPNGSRADLSETVGTYESVAEEYERRHGDRSVVRDQRQLFLDALDPSPGGSGERPRVLDAGCGPGWESAAFADRGCSVLAVDVTRAFLAQTRDRIEREGVPAEAAGMDMRRLGVRDDALDGVWACASFLHVPREEAPGTLAEFARVLRPGGALLLAVKRGSGVLESSAYDGDSRRFVLYEPDEIRGLVEDAGFEVEFREVGEGEGQEWIVLLARA